MINSNANVFPSPTYLAPFVDDPKPEFRELITKDYGEYISVFQLNVQLDHMAISVDEDECYTGLIHAITTDGKTIQLFDALKNGYDAQVGASEEIIPGQFLTIDFQANESIVIVLQYSDEEEEMAAEYGGIAADYFGTLAIYKSKKEGIEEIFCFECQ